MVEGELAPGSVLNKRYRIRARLGRGGFGITYEAEEIASKERVAIKEYFPHQMAARRSNGAVVPASGYKAPFDKYLREFRNEAEALARFDHPNIVHVLARFSGNGTAYFVMEFIDGPSLAATCARTGPLDGTTVMLIGENLVEGVKVVHDYKLLHRDIKPGNVLLAPVRTPRPTRLAVGGDVMARFGRPVLIDFGAARAGSDGREMTGIATPGFAAPEQSVDRGRQDVRTDIYGLGATLYFCLGGSALPEALERKAVIGRGGVDPLEPAQRRFVGKAAPSFLRAIDMALRLQPEERPKDVRALRAALFADVINSPSPPARVDIRPEPVIRNAPHNPTPKISPPSPPATAPTSVDATVFAPKKMRCGMSETVKVAVHRQGDLGRAKQLAAGGEAREADGRRASETWISVALEGKGASVFGPLQRRAWRQDGLIFEFDVEPQHGLAQVDFTVRVLVENAQIGAVQFKRPLINQTGRADVGHERLVRTSSVFIAHSGADRAIASEVTRAYTSVGVKVTNDPPPQDVRRAIESSDVFHLCWSPAAAASTRLEGEILHALEVSRRQSGKRPIVTAQLVDGRVRSEPSARLLGADFASILSGAFSASDSRA